MAYDGHRHYVSAANLRGRFLWCNRCGAIRPIEPTTAHWLPPRCSPPIRAAILETWGIANPWPEKRHVRRLPCGDRVAPVPKDHVQVPAGPIVCPRTGRFLPRPRT
jgi:hypothetical protein